MQIKASPRLKQTDCSLLEAKAPERLQFQSGSQIEEERKLCTDLVVQQEGKRLRHSMHSRSNLDKVLCSVQLPPFLQLFLDRH